MDKESRSRAGNVPNKHSQNGEDGFEHRPNCSRGQLGKSCRDSKIHKKLPKIAQTICALVYRPWHYVCALKTHESAVVIAGLVSNSVTAHRRWVTFPLRPSPGPHASWQHGPCTMGSLGPKCVQNFVSTIFKTDHILWPAFYLFFALAAVLKLNSTLGAKFILTFHMAP